MEMHIKTNRRLLALIVLVIIIAPTGFLVYNTFFKEKQPEINIEVPFNVKEDDPEIESKIISTRMVYGNLVIEYESDHVPVVEGLSDDRYDVQNGTIVVFRYRDEKFRLIFGDSSDVYEFGTLSGEEGYLDGVSSVGQSYSVMTEIKDLSIPQVVYFDGANYIYETCYGTYTWLQPLNILRYDDLNGTNAIEKSVFVLQENSTGTWLALLDHVNKQVLEYNDTYFRLGYDVNYKSRGKDYIVGSVEVEFKSLEPPKTSVNFIPSADWVTIGLGDFRWIYDIIPNITGGWMHWSEQNNGYTDISALSTLQYLGTYTKSYFTSDTSTEGSEHISIDVSDHGVSPIYGGPESYWNTNGFVVIFPVNEGYIDPSTVGTTTTTQPLGIETGRVPFYDGTNYFLIYHDGTNIVYRNSTDATTWSDATTIYAGVDVGSWAASYNGSKVHATRTSGTIVYYKQGTIAGATINFGGEQTVYTEGGRAMSRPAILCNSSGFIFLQFQNRQTGVMSYCQIAISTNTAGTGWSAPHTTNNRNTDGYADLARLDNGGMYVTWAWDNLPNTIYGELWESGGWVGVETIVTNATGAGSDKTLVNDGNNVWLGYEDSVNDLRVIKRAHGAATWGNSTVVADSLVFTSTRPMDLLKDGSKQYLFYIDESGNVVYKLNDGGWGVEQLISDVEDTPTYIASAYEVLNGQVCLAWRNGSGSPYDVRFHTFSSGAHLTYTQTFLSTTTFTTTSETCTPTLSTTITSMTTSTSIITTETTSTGASTDEDLWVDGCSGVLLEWDTEQGVSPWINDTDADWIHEEKTDGVREGNFTFEDSSGSGTINSVTLYFECQSDDAPNNDGFWVYVYDGSSWSAAQGPVRPTSPTGTYAYDTLVISAIINSWAKVDDCQIMIEYEAIPVKDDVYIRRCFMRVNHDPETTTTTCTTTLTTSTSLETTTEETCNTTTATVVEIWTVIQIVIDPTTTVTVTSGCITSIETTTTCTTSVLTSVSTTTSCTSSTSTSLSTSISSTTTCTTSVSTSVFSTTTCTTTVSTSESTTCTTTTVTHVTSTSTTCETSVSTSVSTTCTTSVSTSVSTTETCTTTVETSTSTSETTTTTCTTSVSTSISSTTTTTTSISTSISSTTTCTSSTSTSVSSTTTCTTTVKTSVSSTTTCTSTTSTSVSTSQTTTTTCETSVSTSESTTCTTTTVTHTTSCSTTCETSIFTSVSTTCTTTETTSVSTSETTTTTCETSVSTSISSTTTCTSSTSTSISSTTTCTTSVSTSISSTSTTTSSTSTSISSTTTCTTSVSTSVSSTTTCTSSTSTSISSTTTCTSTTSTSISTSETTTTTCETSVFTSESTTCTTSTVTHTTSTSTTCETSTFTSVSTTCTTTITTSVSTSKTTTTSCTTSVSTSISSTTTCTSSTSTSVSSTTTCITSVSTSISSTSTTTSSTSISISSTTTCTTSVSTSLTTTTTCETSVNTSESTSCTTTTITHVTSTSTTCETSISTSITTTCTSTTSTSMSTSETTTTTCSTSVSTSISSTSTTTSSTSTSISSTSTTTSSTSTSISSTSTTTSSTSTSISTSETTSTTCTTSVSTSETTSTTCTSSTSTSISTSDTTSTTCTTSVSTSETTSTTCTTSVSTSETTSTTCTTSVSISETVTSTTTTSVSTSETTSTTCTTSISTSETTSTTCTSTTSTSISTSDITTTTCTTSVSTSETTSTTCTTSISTSETTSTTCTSSTSTSISSTSTTTSSTSTSISSTSTTTSSTSTSISTSETTSTTCTTSVSTSKTTSTTCTSSTSTSESTSETTTTTCTTSVSTSETTTTTCDTSTTSSTSTTCRTTTVTHVTSTSTTCETSTSTSETTTTYCTTSTSTSTSSTSTTTSSTSTSISKTTTSTCTTSISTSETTSTTCTTSVSTSETTSSTTITSTSVSTSVSGSVTTTTVLGEIVVIDGCVIDEFNDDTLVAWYNVTQRNAGGWVEVVPANTSGQVWSENMLAGLNVTSIIYFKYNITIPPGATPFGKVEFSQDNATWVGSNGIAAWEAMTDGENTILLTGLGWSGNFYYRIWMMKNATGTSPTLDYVQVCYSTLICGGGNWNILMVPLVLTAVMALIYVMSRRRRR